MVWFHVDDGLADHPKVLEAGNCAMGLWVRAGSWSARHLTDGHIPTHIAHQMGTHKQCEVLVTCHLWERVDGGYKFHDWGHRQVSKVEVEVKREIERKRKAEQRKASSVPTGQRDGVSAGTPNGTTSPSVREDSSRAGAGPSLSLPSSGYLGEESHLSNARDPTPPPPCIRHGNDYAHDENCGTCKRRREYDERITEETKYRRSEAIRKCGLCDNTGKVGLDDGAFVKCPHSMRLIAELNA